MLFWRMRTTAGTGTSQLRPSVIRVDTWKELRKKLDAISAREGTWLFRGVSDSSYRLKTSLERAVDRLWPVRRPGLPPLAREFPVGTNISSIEMGLIRQFVRQLHLYAPQEVPVPDRAIERLALMQHHYAPTRLLDWTYSPYVAAFFAVEQAKGTSAVWAINREELDKHRKKMPATARCIDSAGGVKDSRECFDKLFRSGHRFVSPVNPIRLTQRLVIQQGIFLCPGDVETSFETNLAASLLPDHRKVLQKIVISGSPEVRRTIMLELHRMNMSRAVLFPGFDGFTESLREYVAMPTLIPPVDDHK